LESILPAYNDPLFSVMLIIVIGLIIAVATYGWGIYKQQKEQGNLLKFLDKFDSSECALDTKHMPYEAHMLRPLSLLAKAFENAGEYPKAISIYLHLIKHVPDEIAKIELMEHLGKTYVHAGFLERARSIYTDILRKKPRNIKILYALGIVHEMTHNYKKAKEVIEPLELLNEDTHTLKKFLEYLELQMLTDISTDDKIKQLKKLLEEEPSLYREIVSTLLKLNTQKAWEIIDPARLKEVLDILWFLPNSQLDLDIIKSNNALTILYYAKGYLPRLPKSKESSGIFALDMLASARENGFKDGDLHFSYLCKKCKQSFPVSFKRCPNCMAIHSVKVEENIGKAHAQTDYSLL